MPRKAKLNLSGTPAPSQRGEDMTLVPETFECDGCEQTFPTTKFIHYLELLRKGVVDQAEDGAREGDRAKPPRLCDYCAMYGPPMENPLATMSKPEIEALAVLAAGGSMRRAALVMGVSERQIRSYLSGREKHMLRAAYGKLLLQIGITPMKLAETIFAALDAEKPYFNKERGGFDMFPDHATRIRAAAMAQRVLQLEQPSEMSPREEAGRGPSLHFSTNLGDGTTQVVDDAYEISVRRRPAVPVDARDVTDAEMIDGE